MRQKTHFKSKKTHSLIQGKRRRPIRARHSASHGFMGPHVARNRHTQSLDMCNRDKGTHGDPPEEAGGGGAQWAVGRPTWSVKRTKAPPTLPFDVSLAHWSEKAVEQGMATALTRAHPWLPPINMRGGGKNQDTTMLSYTSIKCSLKPSLGLELS